MNTHKINYQEQIQQGHGLVSDFSFDFPDWDQIQQANCNHQQQQQHPCAGSDSNNIRSQNQQNLRPPTIMGGFKSPASAFYATELFMGFDSQFANTTTPMTSQVSRTCDSQIFSSGGTASSIGSAAQSDPSFDVRNTLQSIVKSHLCGNQFSNMNPRSTYDVPAPRQFLNPYVEDQDQRVHGSSYNSQLSLSSEQEKLSSGEGSASTAAVVSSKIRIRWTQELHEKFVECINRLGGAEKATPKAILKLMDSDGLTIFHVKSHLQKYRIAKYMPEKAEGKSDKRATVNDFPQLDSKTGLQIKEALQLQLDVQKRLHEQLEIQRNLQLRIEEQGKQLRVMFDQQQKANGPMKNNDISNSPEDLEDEEDGSNNTIFPSKIS